jgi:hypothetical protein
MVDKTHALTFLFTVALTRLLLMLGGCYTDKHPEEPKPAHVAADKDASR